MKLFKFDQNDTLVDKVIAVGAPVLVVLLIAFLYASIFGAFNNDIAAYAKAASPGYHTLGFIFFLVAVVVLVAEWMQFTPIKSTIASVILFGVLLALSILSYCGFFIAII